MVEPLPELEAPHALVMLRPWVDVGSVGTIVLSRLERHLDAAEVGKLARPGNFYDFTRYRPVIAMREGIRDVTIPNSFIYACRREGARDLLLFHLLEPHAFGEDFAEGVTEVLQAMNVARYSLVGAMYDAVPHTRPLMVTGSVQGPESQRQAREAKVEESTYEGPTTIMYVANRFATDHGMETASMIVHLPQYVQLDEDFSGAARLLESLRLLYDLPERLIDDRLGRTQYDEVSQALESNPRLKEVVQQLERNYDARPAARQATEQAPLAPEIERFLKEIDQGFDSN